MNNQTLRCLFYIAVVVKKALQCLAQTAVINLVSVYQLADILHNIIIQKPAVRNLRYKCIYSLLFIKKDSFLRIRNQSNFNCFCSFSSAALHIFKIFHAASNSSLKTNVVFPVSILNNTI